MAARWHPAITAEPLWPSADPVVMEFKSSEAWPPVPRGWAYGSASVALRPQPVAGGYTEGTDDAICPGGRFLMHQNVQDFAAAGSSGDFWAIEGIYRVDVTTGAVVRAGFEPQLVESVNALRYGGSPDGQQVVIAERFFADSESGVGSDHPAHPINQEMPESLLTEVRRHYFRTRFVVATFDGQPPRTIASLHAGIAAPTDANPLQWSPNGRLVALSLRSVDPYSESWGEVTVIDPSTGQIVIRLDGGVLAGSASWGPASDRLVVEGPGDEAWVHHLDGTREPITVLPPYGTRDLRPIRVLGMADNEHLLTLRIYGADGILMRTSLRDGSHERLLIWEGQKHMYPVLAQMPPETWS